MSCPQLFAVAAARIGVRTSARVAYRALHRKYLGPPNPSSSSPFRNPKKESFHDLQAELP